MKNSTILSICLIAFISIIGLSCEKNSEEINFTEVEYGILNIDDNIVYITYNDAAGKPVGTNDRGQFANGSKKLSVSTKPFTAKINVRVYNTTPGTISYTIGILVNGESKAITSVVCFPGMVTHGEVEFTVQ